MATRLSTEPCAALLSLVLAVLASCGPEPTETASAADIEAAVQRAERDVPAGAATAGTVSSSASDLTVLD